MIFLRMIGYSFVRISEIIAGRNVRFYYEIHGVAIPVKIAENGLIQIDYCYMIVRSVVGTVYRALSLNRSKMQHASYIEKKLPISQVR